MGWQDIVGGGLAGFATGDPMAWQKQKLAEAYKQFQMQQGTEELKMRKDMLDIEKRKVDATLRNLEAGNIPAEEIFGGNQGNTNPAPNSEEGGNNVAPQQGKVAAYLDEIFGSQWRKIPVSHLKDILPTVASLQKDKPKFEQVKGSKNIAFFNPQDPNNVVTTGMEAGGSEKTQLVGHTPEGLPVVFDPIASQQLVNGKPYTGKVIPRAEYPSMTFVGTVPGQPNQAIMVDKTGKFTQQSMPSPAGVTGKEVRPLPEKAMDNLQGALDSLKLLDQLEEDIDAIVGLPVLGDMVTSIRSYGGNKAAQRWKANYDKLRANAQTIIKGIPSNFDVETFIKTLPSTKESIPQGKERIKAAREELVDAIRVGIQNYEGSNMQIPAYLKERANKVLGGGASYTQEDLEFTAKKHGITVDEVKKRLGAK